MEESRGKVKRRRDERVARLDLIVVFQAGERVEVVVAFKGIDSQSCSCENADATSCLCAVSEKIIPFPLLAPRER